MDPFEPTTPETPAGPPAQPSAEAPGRAPGSWSERGADAGGAAGGVEGDAGPASGAEVDLACDVCGAPIRWSPGHKALRCEHCGGITEVEVEEADIEERPLEAAGSAARGLGVEVRLLECQNCAARVTLDDGVVSEACPFCGSPNVLDQEASRNALRPESLIPLEVGRAQVEENFRRWVGRLWFRPNAIKRVSTASAVGVYVPAWAFDADVVSRWTAQSGTYYWVTESYTVTVNGKPQVRTRQVRRVRWWPSNGRRRDLHDDVVVFGSKGVDRDLAARLGPYGTADLVPYSPAFLAGWRAEEYQVDLQEGWKLGREQIRARQRERCAGDVPGDTHRHLRVRNEFHDVRWKLMLLPMWSVTYQFGGKAYAVLVHGETGAVAGRAPYSWVKIGLAVGAALLAGAGAVFLNR